MKKKVFRLAHLYNRADLDFHANDSGLDHWSCNKPCFKCPCNKSDNSYANFGAAWRTQSYDVFTWSPPNNPLYQAPWASPRMAAIDPAHTLDKGVLEHLLGSLFYDLVYDSL